MKLEDMILVTENRKGTESIFLLNLPGYMEMVLNTCEDSAIDMADAVKQLYETKEGKGGCSELYFRANISSQAMFCMGEAHLRCFLLGLQDGAAKEVKPVFDEARCTPECFGVLKSYGIGTDGHSLMHSLHYEPQEYDFCQGEILHNLNGSDYRVLSVLGENNLLLMSQSNGQYIVAVNTVMYERYPKEGHPAKDSVIRGIEWGHGVYLGTDIMKIDLDGILQEYGSLKPADTIMDYREEAVWQFRKLKSLSQNERLAPVVRWAAEENLGDTFGTTDRERFEHNLEKGDYDAGFQKTQKETIKKSR